MAKKRNSLRDARTAKNDEFYTLLADIEKELSNYEEQFRGKAILCNCDDPRRSNFWRYFHENFERLGLRKLTATFFSEEAFAMTYEGGADSDIGVGEQEPLLWLGDFRNSECIGYLEEADIVVTNPPFSLMIEYIGQLMEHQKKFLLIAGINVLCCDSVFPCLREGRISKGYNTVKDFIQPDGQVKSFGNICWLTNLDITHERPRLLDKLKEQGYCYYAGNEKNYPIFYNCNGINVDRLNELPVDYEGMMGLPITFLDYYNPDEFELIGVDGKVCNDDIELREIGKEWCTAYYEQGNTGHYSPSMRIPVTFTDGIARAVFRRVFVRNRHPVSKP